MTERFPPDKKSNRSHRIVIFYGRSLRAEDLTEELFKVFPVVYKIDLRRVDDQEWCGLVPEKEIVVRFVEVPNVLFRNGFFDRPSSPPDICHQPLDTRLQIHDEVWRGDILLQLRYQGFVEPKLIVPKVEVREDLVFLEHVVRHDNLLEQISLEKLLLLTISAQKEEDLRLKGIVLWIFVELFEEWVLLKSLKDSSRPEPFAEHLCECRLPDPDDSLDCNVPDVSLGEKILFCRFRQCDLEWTGSL